MKLPLHVASLWLALAVALLSSLMPSGLPRTIAVGSAFNPATTAVALQPRTQARVVAETVRRDDDPASGQGGAAQILSQPILTAPRPDVIAAVPKPAAVASPVGARAVLDGSPRGPPLT
ncbi:hypothetical protein [Sphingomonas sp. MS122]|uniref:hypothetical protein n=1 Tax=Sphingomonas sp. MS122 TaxID=3412683 RepID=UPI003C2D3F6D